MDKGTGKTNRFACALIQRRETAERGINKILIEQLETSQSGMLQGAEGLRKAAACLHLDADAAAVELLNVAASMERTAGQWRDTVAEARHGSRGARRVEAAAGQGVSKE